MIPLKLVKQHLRVVHNAEDELINSYLHAAIDEFECFTERKLYASDEDLEVDQDAPDQVVVLDDKITSGLLLLIGYLYSIRDKDAPMPRAVKSLWQGYRVIKVL